MRKITIVLVLILAGYFTAAQDCGTYIELIGVGMLEKEGATLTISNVENVEMIVVEAIQKSLVKPTPIAFSSSNPSQLIENVLPEEVNYSGTGDLWGYTAHFYRAILDPAEEVSIDPNGNEIFSFAAYVYRKSSSLVTASGGELYHVFQNGDDDPPLTIQVPVAVSDHPRDINIRFGISELDEDERYAIFKFKAGEGGDEVTVPDIQVYHWNPGEFPSYTIHKVMLEDVPGNVDLVEVTMISPVYNETGRTGDSFIAGIVLADIPCEYEDPEMYCTYTQGFYGNEGGKTCAGETTRELLLRLLTNDLILGSNGNTFTVIAGDADCIIDILPGGGPSKTLDGEATCENPVGVDIKKGRLNNTLLAQGITLALNLLNNPDLPSFPVDGTEFVTLQALDCTDPESGSIPGTETIHAFSQEIVDYLGTTDPTIGGLLELVNHALGGGDISPLSLSQVSDAATLVNEAFDECVLVPGTGDVEPGTNETITGGNTEGDGEGDDEGDDEFGNKDDESAQKGTTGISGRESANGLHLYPNPVIDRFYVTLPSAIQHVEAASIYSMAGLPVKSVKDQVVSGGNHVIGIDAGELIPGIYFIKIDTDAGTFVQRFGVQ